jgi:hypothetical protein
LLHCLHFLPSPHHYSGDLHAAFQFSQPTALWLVESGFCSMISLYPLLAVILNCVRAVHWELSIAVHFNKEEEIGVADLLLRSMCSSPQSKLAVGNTLFSLYLARWEMVTP